MSEPTGTQTVVPATQALDKLNAAFEPKRLEQIQLALPDNVSADKFLQIANRALLDNTALMAADRPSLFTAVSQCAASGLEPDGKQAALVIYKTKVKAADGTETYIQKVQFMPMVGGFRKIAAEHGWSIEDEVVREHDEFEHEGGLAPKLRHVKPRPGVDRGALEGAYAICRHRGHDPIIAVLDREDVMRLKKASKTSAYGPWKDWEPEMWRKSAARKAFKQLPLGEKETVRLRALLDESGASADPVAALYGGEDRPALPPAGENPQAAPAAPPAGGGSGPVDWDTIGAGHDEPVQSEAQRIGQTVIPGGLFANQTIAEACQSPEGQLWLLAVLQEAPAEDTFRAAVAAYVQGEQTEMWASYQAVRKDTA